MEQRHYMSLALWASEQRELRAPAEIMSRDEMERPRYVSLALWTSERRDLKVRAGELLNEMPLSYPAWIDREDAPEDETPAEPSSFVDASRDAA